MTPQKISSLRKRVEGEFSEEETGITKLIDTLMRSFLRADSDYGAIADIKTDINHIYGLVKNYISEERLDVYALKLEDRILMSKTNVGFDELYEVIRERSNLKEKSGMVEIWDDQENKILHFLIIPLRKHFPIEYSTEAEKEKIINTLLKEYADI
ncbi:MAG: hypothetical protein QW502_02825 [Candidatus Bathyarchaeia archaeon]|nr:hypothetical protein [Candidatus Bathyarchaeota archaeon]